MECAIPPEELNAQWYDRDYWDNVHKMADAIDAQINAFNQGRGPWTHDGV
jgi:hypothetical protein